MNVNENQWTHLMLGGVCIYGLSRLMWICFRSYKRAANEHQNITALHEEQQKKKIDFDAMRKDGKCQDVLLQEVRALNSQYDSLLIRERQRPIVGYQSLLKTSFYHNIVGGYFNLKFQNKEIVCDVKDTSVSANILREIKTPVSIFKTQQPVVEKVDIILPTGTLLTIYGSLCFEASTSKWVLQPYFMGQSLKQILEYWSSEKVVYSMLIGLLGMCAFVTGALMTKAILSMVRNYQEKYKQIGKGQLSHFKSKPYISANPRMKLNCSECHTNSVQIVYECGHLVFCSQCHEKRKEKNNNVCSTCKKESRKFMKLYLV